MNAYRKPADDIHGALERHEAIIDSLGKKLKLLEAKPPKPAKRKPSTKARVYGWYIAGTVGMTLVAWLLSVGAWHFVSLPDTFWNQVWDITFTGLALLAWFVVLALALFAPLIVEKIEEQRAEEVE